MPPKGPLALASAVHEHRPSSPVSPASFDNAVVAAFPSTTTTMEERTVYRPLFELESGRTMRESLQEQQSLVLLPTTFRLIPRAEQQQAEVPQFLAYLNKLHGSTSGGGEQGQQPQQPQSVAVEVPFGNADATSSTTSSNKKARTEKQRRRVRFAEAKLTTVHPVVSRHDMTPRERLNTWYTEQYLRTKGQLALPKGDQREELAATSAATSSSQRHLVLAALYIRRGRKTVMTEQARYPYLSATAASSKSLEDCIRDAYHKVTLTCQRDAKERGEAAAKIAAKL